jgi:NAD(P)-dependent dehydrogenase (short-subunit alcohol dehydrogenase family)
VGQEEQQLNRLQGKIAVITGGSSGMGFATAEQFVSEGAYVYITGRREKELDAAVAKIGKNIAAVQGIKKVLGLTNTKVIRPRRRWSSNRVRLR